MVSQITFNVSKACMLAAILLSGCRADPNTASQEGVNQYGDPGSGYTVQCSGWFPDWISSNPPSEEIAFQISQGYPLGKAVIADRGIVGYSPLDPPTSRPWMSHDFRNPTQADDYAQALLDYAFDGLRKYEWDPNRRREIGTFIQPNWFHAPMMHTNPNNRREPLKGVTSERALRSSENSWVNQSLRTYAVGFYDQTAGYTIGQVYGSKDPSLADPTKSEFIDNAYIFKLIFAEYDPSKIVTSLDPLVNSPEWEIQDVSSPSGALIKIRLIQVDVAIKDPRATETGWVFGTYAYDKDLIPTRMDPDNPSLPDAWHRLTPVGLQWGADLNATPFGSVPISETWINPTLPQVWLDRIGLGDRLNGPIDNPASSCMSCHSTAQVDVSKTNRNGSIADFTAGRMLPPNGCSTSEKQQWYRNFNGTAPFGDFDGNCSPSATPNPNLVSLDYSLQLSVGLVSAMYYQNANPCYDPDLTTTDLSGDQKFEIVTDGGSGEKVDDEDIVFQKRRVNLLGSSESVGTIRLDYSGQLGVNKDGITTEGAKQNE